MAMLDQAPSTLIDISENVFNDAYVPYLDNQARIQIFFGGAGSGKSVFLAQRAVIDILNRMTSGTFAHSKGTARCMIGNRIALLERLLIKV